MEKLLSTEIKDSKYWYVNKEFVVNKRGHVFDLKKGILKYANGYGDVIGTLDCGTHVFLKRSEIGFVISIEDE